MTCPRSCNFAWPTANGTRHSTRLATGYPRRPLAEVHAVVLERFRGRGIGAALVKAAEQYAAEHGVSGLIAPILAPNTDAVSFYSRAGFGPHGVILSKKLIADSDSSNQPSQSCG